MWLPKTGIIGPLALLLPVETGAQSLDLQAGLGYHSDYVSQGRSSINSGGIGEATLAMEAGNFFAGTALIEADSTDYTEINLLAGLGFSAGKFGFAAGVTRLFVDDRGDSAADTELVFELAYEGLNFVIPFGNYVYSVEESASWLELGLASTLVMGGAEVSPYVMTGWNQGYVSGESEGINHVQLGVDLSVPLSEALELNAYLAHSRPVDQVTMDTTQKLVWGGVGIIFSF